MRIVTLLPSATEIVCALGLEEHLVGVSHSCNYPASVLNLPNMTSTRVPYQEISVAIDQYVRGHLTGNAALYDLDIEKLQAVNPDVIISQTLCDVCAVSTGDVLAAIRALPSKPTLIDLEPNTLDDVFRDIQTVAHALHVDESAKQLISSLRARRDEVARRTSRVSKTDLPRVAFLEWLCPPFNGGHWNPELVALAGGIDLLGNPGLPSATQSWSDIVAAQPDVLFIACCGFDVDRALQDVALVGRSYQWQNLPAVRAGRVYVADGNAYFSCPGPRLLDGLEILAHALHPTEHPKRWPQEPSRP